MKKITVLLCLALCAVLALTACGTSNEQGGASSDPVSSMSMADLAADIMGKVEFAMTMPVNMENPDEAAFLADGIGLDAAWMADSSLNVNMMVTADNLFLAEAKTAEDVEKITAAFEQHKQNVIQSFEMYLPEPLEVAKQGEVVTKGRYVMLIISTDNAAAIEAFEAAIN